MLHCRVLCDDLASAIVLLDELKDAVMEAILSEVSSGRVPVGARNEL
jgi:hypothetical protein